MGENECQTHKESRPRNSITIYMYAKCLQDMKYTLTISRAIVSFIYWMKREKMLLNNTHLYLLFSVYAYTFLMQLKWHWSMNNASCRCIELYAFSVGVMHRASPLLALAWACSSRVITGRRSILTEWMKNIALGCECHSTTLGFLTCVRTASLAVPRRCAHIAQTGCRALYWYNTHEHYYHSQDVPL